MLSKMFQIYNSASLDQRKIEDLKKKLTCFYENTDDYVAFNEPSDQSYWHSKVLRFVNEFIEKNGKVSILEVGAGRSTFNKSIEGFRDKVTYHAQDITTKNLDHLKIYADEVHIGDLSCIDSKYDIVFSTFVLEHIIEPELFFEQIFDRLNKNGCHIIICPRYDFPGYICPSLRHYGLVKRSVIALCLFAQNLKGHLFSRGLFKINTNPALFHQRWFRDSDALHLVNGFEVINYHKKNGFIVDAIQKQSFGIKDFILKNYLTLSIAAWKKQK